MGDPWQYCTLVVTLFLINLPIAITALHCFPARIPLESSGYILLYSLCFPLSTFTITKELPLTANHRNIVRMPVLMRELWLEMWHDMHPDSKSKFVTKGLLQLELLKCMIVPCFDSVFQVTNNDA